MLNLTSRTLPWQRALPRAAVALLLPLLALACGPDATEQRVQRDVNALLECQDCLNVEQRLVVALGDTAVAPLEKALVKGPPAKHIAAYAAVLQRLAQRAPPGRAPSRATMEAQLQAVRAQYGARAAEALVLIGSPEARKALCTAFRKADLSPALRASITSGIAQLGGSCR